MTSESIHFLQNEWRHGSMRGSVNSFEHFLQMVLGDSRVTFDAIWTVVVCRRLSYVLLSRLEINNINAHINQLQLLA